jgi:SOS-response transcriptional repressor LexA
MFSVFIIPILTSGLHFVNPFWENNLKIFYTCGLKRFTKRLTCDILAIVNIPELIKFYRKKKGMTLDELGSELGFSKAYLSRVENGKKTISFKQLLKIAAIIEIPSAEIQKLQRRKTKDKMLAQDSFEDLLKAKENLERFLAGQGLTPASSDIVMVPVVGKIRAGTPLDTYEDILDIAESQFPVPVSEVKHNQCFFLKVFGDSMIDAGISDGDLVLINPEDTEISGIGRIMAVEIDGEVTLKTVVRLNERKLRLIAENSRYAPIEVDIKKQKVRLIGATLPFMARWNPRLS